MTWSLVGLSQPFSTLSMGHPQPGIPRDKQQWETATYGPEFVAARNAVDQIVDLRYTLMYLGVPIRSKSFMFGDNKSVITSSTIPNSLLSKRYHLSAYHRVREAIALKYLMFIWKDGKTNPADILSKQMEFPQIWPPLKPLLFWRGETAEIKQLTRFTSKPRFSGY